MRKTWVKRDNIYYKPFYKQKLKMMLLLLLLMAFVFFGYQFFYISQLQTTESSSSGLGSGSAGQQQHHLTNNKLLLHQEQAKKQDSESNDVPPPHSLGNNNQEPRLNDNAVQDEGGGGRAAGEDGNNRTATDFRGPSEDARYVYVEKVGNYEKRILRGIRLRDLDAYSPNPSTGSTTFRCLSSTRQIPWARVNDDYCDCPEDGSDEPSTGACDRGRFYCRFQKRHATGRGGYTSVPSGWANDGVCDCCDGSDEWLSGAGERCRNTCKERFPY